MRKALSTLGILGIGLLLSVALAAPAKPGRKVQDPHYGDVLFYFFQDDYFEAITRLTAARLQGRAEAHAEDGDLLLGGMLLSYGQLDQATALFRRVLDNNAKPAVRDRAWFFLARAAYDRGALAQAEEALTHIGSSLPVRLAAEARILHAQVLMEQTRYDEAADILNGWTGPSDWASYARFNLGVALVRAGRPEQGLPLLAQVGSQISDDPEQLALKDRANVALAYTQLQGGQPEAARTALQRVRLEGSDSNKALLGLGWAESALGRDQEALVPWLELQKRSLLDPAVEESFLAVPYAMGRLHANSDAAQHYELAIKVFDDESQRLDASIGRIRDGKLLAALLAADKTERKADAKAGAAGGRPDDKSAAFEGFGSGLRLDQLPGTDESRYLLYLLASRPFQEGLKNYRDLRFLHDNLARWSSDVAVFSDMLATQKLAYERRQPAVQTALKAADLEAIEQRRAQLAARLETIRSQDDAIGLASTEEGRQWAKLDSIAQRIDALGEVPEAAGLREQVRLLQGVLRWNLDHAYPLRVWQQTRAQAGLDAAVEQARAQRQAVETAQQSIPGRVAGFAQRIGEQTPRIAALQKRTDSLLQRQQAYLQKLAIDSLEQYKQRLYHYGVEARFALAQIYDRAASHEPPAAAEPSVAPPAAPPAGPVR